MNPATLQDILPFVEKPSSYLGTEINAIKKDLDAVKLKIALAFPDTYEIGMSHFGIQILYHILNRHNDIAAERVFAPGIDMGRRLKESGLKLMSLESRMPLKLFNIIGFSLLYELNYTNVLYMLDLAGIEALSDKRSENDPIIIAGGPCTCNPEPVADFFDAMVVGDGENAIMEMAVAWLNWHKQGDAGKETLLESWKNIEGVYVPAHYKPHYTKNGFQVLQSLFNSTGLDGGKQVVSVRRAIVADLNRADFPTRPIVPFGKPVHDRLRLEISRGCTRGCRFCQAGMIYRPVRERRPGLIMDLADSALNTTGYGDLSLLSLSSGDYGCIADLMESLSKRYGAHHTAISLPSLRAGTVTPELMEIIKRVRKTGFTIAPEAGSQRLRDVINKNISDDDIEKTVFDAFRLGWQVIKLYFMIGLPSETDDDVAKIVSLIKRLRQIKSPLKRKGQINVSVATFIPKAHTPFQWEAQDRLEVAKEKISWLKKKLKSARVFVKWQNPKVSFLEGLWARGDRRLGPLLMSAYQKGCCLDGWSDHFRFDLWQEAIADCGIDAKKIVEQPKAVDEPLPWDHIDMKISKRYLLAELKKAKNGETTEDCRHGDCEGCQSCDFDQVMPMVFEKTDPIQKQTQPAKKHAGTIVKKVRVFYQKTGPARFFGHLEVMNIVQRAIKRAGIEVKYSTGFHPKPKISFEDPLPVGVESLRESFVIQVDLKMKPDQISAALSKELPCGLEVSGCADEFKKPKRADLDRYEIRIKDDIFDEQKLKAFREKDSFIFERRRPGGKLQTIELKDIIQDIFLHSPKRINLVLRKNNKATVRPGVVLEKIFELPEQTIKTARIIKNGNV